MCFETAGYFRALALVRSGVDLTRVVFLDDVVAQGATRALLECGYAGREVKIVVLTSLQQIVPLGLPITYVIHDTADEVRRAFRILTTIPGNAQRRAPSLRSEFRIATDREVASVMGPAAQIGRDHSR